MPKLNLQVEHGASAILPTDKNLGLYKGLLGQSKCRFFGLELLFWMSSGVCCQHKPLPIIHSARAMPLAAQRLTLRAAG
jgi:hypothetical protein